MAGRTAWRCEAVPPVATRGRVAAQATERADHPGAVAALDQDVAGAAASPPGDDLDGLAAFVVEALAAHKPILSDG
jgi:hypothetical protein